MNLETFIRIMGLPLGLTIDEILESLIIYLRKSRKDMEYYKDESIEKTLERHLKEIQEFITNIFGKPIPDHNIYKEVVSGDTIDDRPVMQEVLSIIEDSSINGVVCVEIERLARGNTIDQGIIAQTFQYTNTKIITPGKIYNLDNEDDLSYFEDGLFQARKYLKYTKRILNRGRLRSVKEGKYVGSILPYGYDKVKLANEKGYVLVENEKEGKVVRLMADLFLNGLNTTYTLKDGDTIGSVAKTFGITKRDILFKNAALKEGSIIDISKDSKYIKHTIKKTDTLDSITTEYDIKLGQILIPKDILKPGETVNIIIEDVRTSTLANYLNYLKIQPRVSPYWTPAMIRNILQSYAVYGYLTWDRRKTTKTLVNGKLVKSNPNNDDYTLVKGRFEPILNDEIKEKIEKKFKDNSYKTVPAKLEQKNPLLGLVVCGYCGRNMTRRPYFDKRKTGTKLRLVYELDKTKLREMLRDYKEKSGLSLTEIARELKLSRSIVANWFCTSDSRFNVPHADKWYQLKDLLNIEIDDFDKAVTNRDYKVIDPHIDTLICNNSKCKCVSSDLELVEDRLIAGLRIILKDYISYVEDYKETVKEEISNNKDLIAAIDKEIDKVKLQLEKACELVETGAYTQDLFLKRSNILNEELDNLNNQKIEISKSNNIETKFENRKKAIPIMENLLAAYSNKLTPVEKNEALKKIVKQVSYKKEKGGRYLKDNFELEISLWL